MERHVTLIRVTSHLRERRPDSADHPTRIMEIVGALGGTTEGIWALGDGPYQYVAVASYPDETSALKARSQIEALGIVTVEGYPVLEMRECLQAMAA